MKHYKTKFCYRIFVAIHCCVLLASNIVSAENSRDQPNVIFILADDLGWKELEASGNKFNETPHLNALAKTGVRFTKAYAAAPVCSPYRAAFLTGQHPARVGITDYLRPNSANGLSTGHVTLAEMFQNARYATGMIGKWHLTGYKHHGAEHEIKPNDHGFDWDFGREVKGVGNGANFWPYVFRKQSIRWIDIPKQRLGANEYLTDRLNVEAVDFIQRHRDRPFFLYLSHYAPHSILNGRPDLVEKYRKKHKPGLSTRHNCYLCQDDGHKGDLLNHWAGDHNPHLAAMLESIDDGVGEIRAKLEELNLLDNTILVFTSDNGGETNVTSNAPLRGGKSQLYEGGIRVPLIVSWPNKLPTGAVCNQVTSNVDFYPTLLEASNIKPDPKQNLDGVSTLSIWQDPNVERKTTESLYWHYPLDKPHFLGGKSAGAILDGDWKLIEFFDTNKTELYRLSNDPSEKQDLSASHFEQTKRLRSKLAAWREKMGATIPSPPMLIEARKLYFADHFSPKQVSDRWFFSKDWSVEHGVLQRSDSGDKATRIFLKNTIFKDAIVRFDFQLQSSKDIRLVTGAGGGYNAVIHIRPDHFYVQTAMDKSGPYFSYRHGECAYDFQPDRWYTMTVEFFGDQLVAHLDRDHVAFAKHPILNKQRTYFAFQVDQSPAKFDNVQVLQGVAHPKQAYNLKQIDLINGKHPVTKPLAEQFEIQKRNAHEWFYQRREQYRVLVNRVDELDQLKKSQFPEVFQTNKEAKKQIAKLRKKLLAEDPIYKKTLFATYAVQRAITKWLIEQKPAVDSLPNSQRKREIERLRIKYQTSPEYLDHVATFDAAQRKLESDYPQLFVSDKEINQRKNAQRQKVSETPKFREMTKQRAAAYRKQQAYLFKHDAKLLELQKMLDQKPKL